MSALIDHASLDQKIVLDGEVVELGARVGVGDRNLYGFNIQFLGKSDRVFDSFARFPGQAENEVSMDDQAELVRVLGELASPFEGCALLDVLEDLLIAGFV